MLNLLNLFAHNQQKAEILHWLKLQGAGNAQANQLRF
jgi:hypothetical protein